MENDHSPPGTTADEGSSSYAPSSSGDISFNSDLRIETVPEQEIRDLSFAGFQVGEHIATGGQGVVVSAQDETLNREVALKILVSRRADNDRFADRFTKEAILTANLQHPGIVPVYSAGLASDGRPFFSMRRVEGETLEESLKKRTSVKDKLPNFLRVFLKICQTISYCHDHGVVHCDLKPRNIMLGTHGEVLVMDFGLAVGLSSIPENDVLDEESPPLLDSFEAPFSNKTTATKSILGTPQYMSPEQAMGERSKFSERTDVFGLGTILYEILTGEALYAGDTTALLVRQAAHAVLDNQIDKLAKASCDPHLAAICIDCLNADPEQRPPNGKSLVSRVTAYFDLLMSQAESDLEHFFNLSPDLFCIATDQGEFLRVNPNFSRVLGYTEAEILAVPLLTLVHPHDLQKTVNAMQTLREGKPVTQFLNRFQSSTGEYRWFEWAAKSMPETDLIFAAARDVTLNMEDRLFSKILDVTPRALVVIDKEGRIVLVNESTEELFGHTKAELLGRPVEILVPDYIRGVHVELRNSYLQMPKSGKGPRTRSFITTKHGTKNPVEIELSSLETDVGDFAVAWIRERNDSADMEPKNH